MKTESTFLNWQNEKNNNNKALLFSLVYARSSSSKMKEIRTKASKAAHVSCSANDPFELKWL